MLLLKNRRVQISAAAAVILCLILIFVGVMVADKDSTNSSPSVSGEKKAEGFTFFAMGRYTRYAESIRKNMEEKLGSDVLETKSTIDLTTNSRGFLKSYLPEIYRLNMKLNDETGARVEHNIIKLTYRYALKKNTPFFYVELVFSNASKRPLYFKINAKKEAAGIINEIREKYGEPQTIELPGAKGTVFQWQRDNDVFVISKKKDRLGDPEFHLMIYFVENIKDLVRLEEGERKKREEVRKKAVRKAF